MTKEKTLKTDWDGYSEYANVIYKGKKMKAKVWLRQMSPLMTVPYVTINRKRYYLEEY